MANVILVTGGSGFIGQVVVRHLNEAGHEVRLLLHPRRQTPRLPRGVPVEVALTGLNDRRGLRAALQQVSAIIHLAGSEWEGGNADLVQTDIEGTRTLAEVAKEAGVEHFIYLSHLGAASNSAFPVMRAKGLAEESIRSSGVPFTIVRSAIVFGPGDHFTVPLARVIHQIPFVFPVPAMRTVIQPLWVEDLAACLSWTILMPQLKGQTIEIGGGEYFSFSEIMETIFQAMQVRRRLVPLSLPVLRALLILASYSFPHFPFSTFWLDYISVNRTCPVENITRIYGLMPARFAYRLEYLVRPPWHQRLRSALSSIFAKRVRNVSETEK